jgi:uncharacterized protein (DUF58 family)
MALRYNALVLAVVAAFVAIVSLWGGQTVLAGAWRIPVGVLLLGLAYEAWFAARARLQAAVREAPHGALGRTVTVQFELTHRLQRAVTVELAASAPAAVEVDEGVQRVGIPPGEAAVIAAAATPRRLGVHAWPEMRARIAGPLGLAWWPQRLPVQFMLRVGPDMLRDEVQRLGALAGGIRSRASFGAGLEVLQLRDYRPGDPLHLIDWKATARGGRLVSRDFAEDQHLDIIIALDAGRSSGLRAGSLDRLGHYANVAARFAEYAVQQDDRVGLLVFADRPLTALAPARGAGAVIRIRNVLSASTVVQAESNPLNAALRIRTLAPHRSLVVMLTDLDDAATAGQLATAARLLLPKHLPLIAGLSSRQVEALAHAPATGWLDPYESLAAQEYCLQLERNVRALHALGAPALLAHPDQIERAVFNAYADFRRRRRV